MDGGVSRTFFPNVVHDSGVVCVCDHLCTRASTGELHTERLQGMLQRVHLFDMIIARNPLLAEIHPGRTNTSAAGQSTPFHPISDDSDITRVSSTAKCLARYDSSS